MNGSLPVSAHFIRHSSGEYPLSTPPKSCEIVAITNRVEGLKPTVLDDGRFAFAIHKELGLENFTPQNQPELLPIVFHLSTFFGRMIKIACVSKEPLTQISEHFTMIAALKELGLQYLDLADGADDNILEALKPLTTLKELRLYDCTATDRGLTHLLALENLKTLHLTFCTKLTQNGVAELRSKMKNLTVYAT